MKFADALARVFENPRNMIRRSGCQHGFMYDPKFDVTGLRILVFDPSADSSVVAISGAGFGVDLFSVNDARAEDWKLFSLIPGKEPAESTAFEFQRA